MKELDLKNISSNELDLSKIKGSESNRNLIESEEIKEPSENIEEDCHNVISEFTKIKNCSILKYGISLSTEKIKFGFCHTCDINLMFTICSECLRECHTKLGHETREMEQPDFILCGCAERMHKFLDNDKKRKNKKFSAECPYSDWCEKSLLSTLYIVNDKCICEFCYRMCGYEGKGRPLEKEKEMLQVCECENLNGSTTHVDLKKIYRKLEEIIDKQNLILGIDPIKFINLLFLGKSSYESIFQNFEEIVQNLNSVNDKNKMILKDNFSSTNFFLSLNVFTKIVSKSKYNPMRYYDRELSKKISFNLISNLLKNKNYYDNKIFWHFLHNMLFLFRKVNIGQKTMHMSKYKLRDLENFSPFQRKIIFMENISIYPEAQMHIEFFIKFLKDLLNEDIQLPEICDVIIQICAILKRLSCFYLFSGFHMNSFCVLLENMFQYLKILKTYHRQIKLFNILIKMLSYFIYSYNDNLFCNFVLENKKEDLSKVKFVFDKNELGRLISRSTIRMMYYSIAIKKLNKLNYKDNRTCERIIEFGVKILNLMISERDNYFMNSTKKDLDIESFLRAINLANDDDKYTKIFDEAKNIEKCFALFYSFTLDNWEVIRGVNDSLERVIVLARSSEMHHHFTKSNFFFYLIKTLYICDLEEKDEEVLEDVDLVKNFISNIFIFLQYFIENNTGNALLLCSYYVINSILKLPDIYIIEIFKLYAHCSDIISKKRGFISNPKYIVKSLYRYLIKFKNESKDKANKEAQDFFMEGVTILDQIIFLFLTIIIQFYLQTKLLYPYNNKGNLKKLIFDFLNVFNFQELMNQNACLLLILINRSFSSSDQIDRELLIKLIPIQKLVLTLEYTNIDIDYRTQILIFLNLFKFTLHYKKFYINKDNGNLIFESKPPESGKIKKPKKLKNLHAIKSKEKVNEIDVHFLFSLNDEEIQKNNNYLNAIGQNGDNFIYIKNNPLISNYKYPTKYLSFYYFFIKNEDIKHIYKIIEASVDLLQKELKRFKDIFEKNINFPNKIFRYLVKGIILPLCPLIKLLFCYTSDCNGLNILLIYQTIMKMLYIKNFILDMNNSFISEKKFSSYKHFDLDGFMDKNNQDENLKDYFNLKNKIKCSPYDFTYLLDIFNKHFLIYIIYPESINLVNIYPIKELDFLTNCKLSEDTDLLEGINIYLRKKGNSLKRKVLNNKAKNNNNFILNTIGSDVRRIKRKTLTSRSFISNRENAASSSAIIEKQDIIQEEDIKIITQRIEKIYGYYIQEKINIQKNNSSLIISLTEICPEYEIIFRKILLTILVNIPGDEMEYHLISRLILYKLLLLTTDDTQNDLTTLIGTKDKEELGFLSNLVNQLYDNIVKSFVNDFNYDFMCFKEIHIEIFTINKILKYLCEEHNNYFQEKLLCNIEYPFIKMSECKMMATNKSKFLSRKISKNTEETETEENMTFFNFLVNILEKILIVTNKVHSKGHISYFFDIVYSIIELLIEIIQGNKKEILSKTKEDESKNNMSLYSLQNFVSIVSEILLDDTLIEGHAFRTRLLLIGFFIAILEEKANEEIQKIIMKFLSINKVMGSISFTMKNYFYEKTKDNPEYAEYYSNYNEKQVSQREFIFDHTVFSFFKYQYFHSDISKNSK